MRSPSDSARRGIGIMFAIVVLAVFGVVSGCAVWQFLAGRQALDRRVEQLQARWLARSGLEAAAERLLAGDLAPASQKLTVFTDSDVVATIEPNAEYPGRFRIQASGTVINEAGKRSQAVLRAIAERIADPPRIRLHILDDSQLSGDSDSGLSPGKTK